MKWIATVVWIIGITTLLYLIDQQDFPNILIAFSLAFSGYVVLSRYGISFRKIMILAIIIRLVSLAALPGLSDDIYRFVWDGRLLLKGINPYNVTPTETRELIKDDQLYTNLNSKEYHSVYPAISQLAFLLSSGGGQSLWWSVLIIRLFIAIFEIALIWQMLKWFRRFQIPDKRVAWYVLNPLVIVETYGNLHFEVVMAFFILMTLNTWRRPVAPALYLSLSVASKVLSMIILPFLFLARKTADRWRYLLAASVFIGLMFLPILMGTGKSGFWQSIGLYFQTFEFNAGVYYCVRWVGYMIKGYNTIAIIGPSLALGSMIILILISYYHRKADELHYPMVIMQLFTVYLLLTTTLHPWYVITPLIFGVMAGYRYIIIWSFVVVFSYNAYQTDPANENVLWLFLEYGALTAAIIYDMTMNPPLKETQPQS